MSLFSTIPLHQPPKIIWLRDATHAPGRFRYCLPEHWALHLYGYSADIVLDGEKNRVQDGTLTLQPPGMVSEYHWRRRSRHIAAHFQLPMVGDHDAYRLPVVLDHRRVRPEGRALLRRAVGCWPHKPARASASVWELLWLLADTFGAPVERMPHPAVARATQYIEKHLDESLTIAQVVAASELSHNHLIRLFHDTFGVTIAAYLRGRRMERAHHLLTNTTMPIKAAAIECGVPDLQAFNKLIRRSFGVNPTQLRAGEATGKRPLGPPGPGVDLIG